MKEKTSGVNIDLGNKCSQTAYKYARSTFINRKDRYGDIRKGIDGAFSNVIEYGDVRLGITSDGIGTKVELAERTGIYDTLGFDLVAMVVDDLAANGFEAANLSNILDVDYLDHEIVDDLMRGLAEAAAFAEISVPGGEIAELGSRISGWGDRMHFNWCSTAVGILPDELAEPISGAGIKPDDKIISLASRGFRSNGFSLLRKVMQAKYGENWHQARYDERRNWGEVLLTPCQIFAPLISALIKDGIRIKGIAHITGGGLADNLYRVLKVSGCGAELDNIFAPPQFMREVQKMGEINEETAYRLWNMGNGMLLIVDSSEADELLTNIKSRQYLAQTAGRLTETSEIIIHSRGNNPQIIKYEIKNL